MNIIDFRTYPFADAAPPRRLPLVSFLVSLVLASCNSGVKVGLDDKKGGAIQTKPSDTIFSSPKDGDALDSLNLAASKVSGKCDIPGQKISLETGSKVLGPYTCSENKTWSATIDFSKMPDGEISVVATVVGKNGKKEYQVNTKFVKDTLPPTVNYGAGFDPIVVRGETVSVKVATDGTGSSIAKRVYQISNDSKTFMTEQSPTSDEFDIKIPSSWVSSMIGTIKVQVTDAAGNKSEYVTSKFQVISKTQKLSGTYSSSRGVNFGLPNDSRFWNPRGLAVDATHLFVLESCFIRRIRISDGFSERLAGFPSTCESVDGVDGKLGNGYGLAVYSDWVYFADYNAHSIRRVNKNQNSVDYKKIETIAGSSGVSGTTDGVGSAARFYLPFGITVVGNFAYISDYGNYTLRRLDLLTNTVVTIAGQVGVLGNSNGVGTAALIGRPASLVYDSHASSGASGSIYFADITYFKIRRFDIATANVTDLVGTTDPGIKDGIGTAARVRNVSGIATDGSFLYFSELYGHVVRKIDLNDATVTTIAGTLGDAAFQDATGLTAKFASPAGLIVISGQIYLADTQNNTIRKIDVGTNAVSRWSGFPYGAGAAYDANKSNDVGSGALPDIAHSIATIDGNILYVGQHESSVIRKIDIGANTVTTIVGAANQPGNLATTPGTSSRLTYPMGVVQIGTKLYVADRNNHNIKMIDLASSNAVTLIAGAVGGASGTTDHATGTSARFTNPWAMATDGTYLYVSELSTRKIRRIHLAGSYPVTTIAGSTNGYSDNTVGLSAQVQIPRSMVVDGTNLYFTDNNAIRKIDLAATSGCPGSPCNPVTTIAGSMPPTAAIGDVDSSVGSEARFNVPAGIAIKDGILYVAETSNDKIKTVNPSTGATQTFAGGPSFTYRAQEGIARNINLNGVTGLTYAAGKFFATSTGLADPYIVQIDAVSGEGKTILGSNYASRSLGRAIVGARDGTAIVDESAGRSLNCFTSDGSKLYAFDASGGVYSYNFDMTGETLLAGSASELGHRDGVGTAARISRVEKGRCIYKDGFIYFTQQVHNTIRKLDLASKEVTTIAGSPTEERKVTDGVALAARLYNPTTVTILGDELYFADASGTLLRRLSLKSNNTVTTVAGKLLEDSPVDGVGTNAAINILGLAALNDKIYFTDSAYSMVKKYSSALRVFNPASSTVELVAGSYSTRGIMDGPAKDARFLYAAMLASDGVNLWISDLGNYSIRKYRPSNGTIRTVYGGKTAKSDEGFGPVETSTAYEGVDWIKGLGLVGATYWTTFLMN